MKEKTINITIPEDLELYINPKNKEGILVRNIMCLYPYIQNRSLSYVKAGKILGLSKQDTIDLYAELGIPYVICSEEELEKDLEVLRKLRESGENKKEEINDEA